MNELHRRAEELASQAALSATNGRHEEAVRLYSQAADVELEALEVVPVDRVRTRSVLSVSAISLLYKAQRLDEAEVTCFRMLGASDLNDWAGAELRVLLEVVSDERLLQRELKRRYSGEGFIVSLRGGAIGSGTGPLDVVLNKTTAVKSLLVRFAEWMGDYPLRVRGAPPKEIQALVQARVTQPAMGSYRLSIRLTEPVQTDMFDEPTIEPEKVNDALFEFLNLIMRGEREALEKYVPDEGYRKAFLELTKAVAPSGKRVREVGLYRSHEGRVESVYMTNAVPDRVRDFLPRDQLEPGEERRVIQGVLRALHLDRNWLEITVPEGEHVKCDTVPDMLDDVVGPMVNNEVVVKGPIRERYGVHRLLVEDIELLED